MKKKIYGRKLSRNRNSRRALFRSLVRSLVLYGSIKTTKAKAKSVRGEIDTIIKKAQDTNISKRRKVYSMLGNDRQIVDRIFTEIAPKLKARNSGFTKTTPLPARVGDLANMVRLEWVEKIETVSMQSAVRSKGKKRASKEPGKKAKAKEDKPKKRSITSRLKLGAREGKSK